MKLNISATFTVKSACKHCLGGPDDFFYYAKKYYSSLEEFKKTVVNKYNNLKFVLYQQEDPKYFDSIKFFAFYLINNNFAPLQKKLRNKNGTTIEITNCFACRCGKTVWCTFSERKFSPNKGKYSYPDQAIPTHRSKISKSIRYL